MAEETKITLRDRDDLGPVLARADHVDNAIEVNRRVFYGLPPMVQEFILCHEVCHLQHNEHDEARTNMLAMQLFMQRATSDADAQERKRFLSYLDGSDMSNITVAAILGLVGTAFSLGTNVWGIFRQRNAGWYSWDSSTQRANMNTMLTQSFEQSRRSSSQSAEQFLWAQLQSYSNKDTSLSQFLGRPENSWVSSWIAKYEQKYGFGFSEVTPVDLKAFPVLMVAVGALVAFAVYKVIKNRK